VPSSHATADSLRDILDNIERIERYRLGLDRTMLEADGQARDAIERCLMSGQGCSGSSAPARSPRRNAASQILPIPRLKVDVQAALRRNPSP
jgi:hypothetical protein